MASHVPLSLYMTTIKMHLSSHWELVIRCVLKAQGHTLLHRLKDQGFGAQDPVSKGVYNHGLSALVL